MIQLCGVGVELNEKPVLHSIDLKWKQGETIALAGANGAGKSTLLKVLAVLIKPSTGEILFPDGTDTKQWRRSLGAVFPLNFLYDALTAMENLRFYARLYGTIQKDKMEEVLAQVGLFQVRNEPVRIFSKGMKQRLSIARALIHQPHYLLLDEPFDGLDANSAERIEELLLYFKKSGTGFMLVSHQLSHAWKLCDRALLLDHGRIRLDEACNDEAYANFLGEYRRVTEKEYGYGIS
jgi:heme exporter protein A